MSANFANLQLQCHAPGRPCNRELPASDCSGLLGKLGWFRDAGKRICIAEVKEVDVECPWASNMLLVLYERWPECEKHDGYIDPEDFHPLDCQNSQFNQPELH